jgi:acetylornithine deacetylase/succinyl-diaminopimelate desuccinylase-like protein
MPAAASWTSTAKRSPTTSRRRKDLRHLGNHGAQSRRAQLAAREDNAIYDLAAAIREHPAYRFPVQYSDMTRNYFKVTGEQLGGELGAAMMAFARDPADEAAAARLARESSYVGTTRTTCVVTMLRAGHAENALPQSATATVNCRIFPGTPVGEVEATLRQVVANDAAQFKQTYEATESPDSELREDVVDAVARR